MEKLKELISRCKASVSVEVNNHRDIYETVDEYVSNYGNGDEKDEIPDEVFAKMVETDTVVGVQFYPNTPIGSYRVWHYDVEQAIDEALRILNENER